MISYVIPTRDRPERLAMTIASIDALGPHDAEVVIVDNASATPVGAVRTLASGVPVRVVRLDRNRGAAGRNDGAQASDPRSQWLVMLDDDSAPTDPGLEQRLARVPDDVLAVSADIRLPHMGKREDGGLPEVFVGCGVAVRRWAFLAAGGYDETFHYYAEEYDLAARLLLAGGRVVFDPGFRVEHWKDLKHRDLGLICQRLVRNNGWIAQRYAPDEWRRGELREVRRRYRGMGEREGVLRAFGLGLRELRMTLPAQRRTPMTERMWRRFIGLDAAVQALAAQGAGTRWRSAAVVDTGKNAWVVGAALAELGVREATLREGEALVIGTMSPGPMIDARLRRSDTGAMVGDGRPVAVPWLAALDERLVPVEGAAISR
ncbi:MAG: glycosyltransferase [Planctomycetota bacterium]|nr:glycosyltransferase [Planctomycetota bacterium]